MCRLSRGVLVPAAAAVLLLVGAAAGRADVTLDVRSSVGVSDNLNLAFEGDNEIDETIQAVGTTFLVRGATVRTSTDLAGNLQYLRYLHDRFDDEWLGGATFNFVGQIVPERISWRITDNYGQQSLNPVEVINPGNRADVNVLRTGPDFMLPIGSRTRADLGLRRAITSFEESNIDSHRDTAQLSFTRQNSQRWSSSIGVSSQSLEYLDVDGFDFDTQAAFVSARAAGGRSSLTLSLGTNRIENAFTDADGTQYGIAFSRQLSGPGVLTFTTARRFSDAGNLFRFLQSNFIDLTVTQDNFATPDAFENTAGFINYIRTTPAADWSVQGFWRKDEFQTQTQFDRDEFGVRLSFRRRLGPDWQLRVLGGSVRRDLQGLRQEDDTHIWAVELSRNVGRTLAAGFRHQYTLRDQMRAGLDRTENRFTIFLDYRRRPTGVGREAVVDPL